MIELINGVVLAFFGFGVFCFLLMVMYLVIFFVLRCQVNKEMKNRNGN